ncbi:hypothetical protein C7M84_011803, partial [Penaeus vannamei]
PSAPPCAAGGGRSPPAPAPDKAPPTATSACPWPGAPPASGGPGAAANSSSPPGQPGFLGVALEVQRLQLPRQLVHAMRLRLAAQSPALTLAPLPLLRHLRREVQGPGLAPRAQRPRHVAVPEGPRGWLHGLQLAPLEGEHVQLEHQRVEGGRGRGGVRLQLRPALLEGTEPPFACSRPSRLQLPRQRVHGLRAPLPPEGLRSPPILPPPPGQPGFLGVVLEVQRLQLSRQLVQATRLRLAAQSPALTLAPLPLLVPLQRGSRARGRPPLPSALATSAGVTGSSSCSSRLACYCWRSACPLRLALCLALLFRSEYHLKAPRVAPRPPARTARGRACLVEHQRVEGGRGRGGRRLGMGLEALHAGEAYWRLLLLPPLLGGLLVLGLVRPRGLALCAALLASRGPRAIRRHPLRVRRSRTSWLCLRWSSKVE